MTVATNFNMILTQMVPKHIDEVLEIEQLTQFDWEPMHREAIDDLRQNDDVGCIVILDGSLKVAGFMIFVHEDTQVVLARIAVHPSCQRRGCAKLMLAMLQSMSLPIIGLIHDTNHVVRFMAEDLGFRELDGEPAADASWVIWEPYNG